MVGIQFLELRLLFGAPLRGSGCRHCFYVSSRFSKNDLLPTLSFLTAMSIQSPGLLREPDNISCFGTNQCFFLNCFPASNAHRHIYFLRWRFFSPLHSHPTDFIHVNLRIPQKDDLDYLRGIPFFNLSIWLGGTVY
jgi:hypothetical protein